MHCQKVVVYLLCDNALFALRHKWVNWAFLDNCFTPNSGLNGTLIFKLHIAFPLLVPLFFSSVVDPDQH